MKNIKLVIAYDGTAYKGWQKTPMGSSIEMSLETILEKILQHKVVLQAASRTDAGVHAHHQVVNFFTAKDFLSLERLKISLNQLLSPDIVVLDVVEESKDFHPTLNCRQKEYHYFICCGLVQMPEHRLYSWHCPRLTHISEMKRAAEFFIGTHDYSSFCNFRKQLHYDSYERKILGVIMEELPQQRLLIKIRGENFLYKMVRNIVGTLVYVARGKIALEQVPAILASHDRTQAGITAPAHGLFLHDIMY